MKYKNVFLTGIAALSIFTGAATAVTTNESVKVNHSCENVLQDGLQSNQTTLFYMYSDNNGHFLLDPLADTENVIFVGHNDFPITKNTLHHGKKFVGTFVDNTLWELTNLQEVLNN